MRKRVEMMGTIMSRYLIYLFPLAKGAWNTGDFLLTFVDVGMDSYAELLHRNPALKPMLEYGDLKKLRATTLILTCLQWNDWLCWYGVYYVYKVPCKGRNEEAKGVWWYYLQEQSILMIGYIVCLISYLSRGKVCFTCHTIQTGQSNREIVVTLGHSRISEI